MATEHCVFDMSFKAENDLSAKQYYFVELSAADQVDVCDGATDKTIGVLQNKPTAGHAAQVRVLGISKVVSNGSGTAIAVGDYVGTDASGKAVKKATDKDFIAGIALDASSADGTVIRVLLTGPFTLSTT
ncbi:MAG: DUF2190 family protein [Deltaproteobacteria bacterium]|nr:DUF2190 family protein [Deltaproteobacteria bacterium]